LPLRIAHVISTRGVGGAERIVAALVGGGAARGFDQVVLNPFADGASESFASLCEPVPYKARRCDRLTELPAVRRWLRSELDDFQADIVHAVLFHARVVLATIARGQGARWLLTQAYDHTLRMSPRAWIKEPVDRWSGRRFDRVVAISDSVHQFLLREYGYPPSKVVRISPGWQGVPLPPSGSDAEPTVVCVAKFRPEKGHTVLLAAFDLVRRQVPGARLRLVGDGELEPELRADVAARGLDGMVEFTGAVPEIWSVLATAHVFALPSLSEAFGIAATEAMAAGLPVVASDVGGLPELVTPGVTGELFPPGDHEALADHLTRLLRSPALRERMGRAARETAQAHSMERSVDRYVALYEEMVDTSRLR
jgi:glycosyltransferase involved in cell wall biosynthesis